MSWWDQPLHLAGSTKSLIFLGALVLGVLFSWALIRWLGRKW